MSSRYTERDNFVSCVTKSTPDASGSRCGQSREVSANKGRHSSGTPIAPVDGRRMAVTVDADHSPVAAPQDEGALR